MFTVIVTPWPLETISLSFLLAVASHAQKRQGSEGHAELQERIPGEDDSGKTP